jgi:hypothetical protein
MIESATVGGRSSALWRPRCPVVAFPVQGLVWPMKSKYTTRANPNSRKALPQVPAIRQRHAYGPRREECPQPMVLACMLPAT